VKERDEVVLSHAAVELHDVADTAEPTAAATMAGAPPKSLALFDYIARRIAENPGWVAQVGAIYQFNLTGSEGGRYVLDLKNQPGRVYPGESETAECALTLAYDDFNAMLQGELDPQQAFMSGKLKISGNIMLSTRLTTLFS
jgi:alkyl sulfatase BDS1-like metallo-beta-lactamase superfamily hydrolase